jgi:PhnB protein
MVSGESLFGLFATRAFARSLAVLKEIKTMSIKPIPDGYQAITPYLIVDGANSAIEFYKTVFGATERMRIGAPGGKIGHAELLIGGSVLMLADEFPEMDTRSPKRIGGTPVSLLLYVEVVDDVVRHAVDAGATLRRAVETKFYGDRSGAVIDPWGHIWNIATHVEDVSVEEMQNRMAKLSPPAS